MHAHTHTDADADAGTHKLKHKHTHIHIHTQTHANTNTHRHMQAGTWTASCFVRRLVSNSLTMLAILSDMNACVTHTYPTSLSDI